VNGSASRFIAHSPLGGFNGHARTASHPALERIARRIGSSPYEVALAWLVESSPNAFVIPGARRAESAVSSANAGSLELGADDREELERAFPKASFLLKQATAARRELRHTARTARTALSARFAKRRSV
jgi:diketogulonate reductase-like aldo/keto reductase